jgi:tyrosyl-tRNA synthetase
VLKASDILFGAEIGDTSEETFRDVVGEVPTRPLGRDRLTGAGLNLIDLLAASGLCPSKGQARKDVEGGGIYINNTRVAAVDRVIGESDLLHGRYILLRKGKRNYLLVEAL